VQGAEGWLVPGPLRLEGRGSEVAYRLGLASSENTERRGSLQGCIRYRLKSCFCAYLRFPVSHPGVNVRRFAELKSLPQNPAVNGTFLLYQVVLLDIELICGFADGLFSNTLLLMW